MKPKTFFILFYLAVIGIFISVVCLATAQTLLGGIVSAVAMWGFSFLLISLLKRI